MIDQVVVDRIRAELAAGELSQREIARLECVSRDTVTQISTGRFVDERLRRRGNQVCPACRRKAPRRPGADVCVACEARAAAEAAPETMVEDEPGGDPLRLELRPGERRILQAVRRAG